MRSRIVVFLATGFEEIEAITAIDVLRRAGLDVETAAVGDKVKVAGAHGIPVLCDSLVSEISPADVLMTVCPGGLPGATNLAASREVTSMVRSVLDGGGWAAAICAAPIVLHAAGVLDGVQYTCYPSFEKKIGGEFTGARVQRSGHVITACGPGASLEFALALVKVLASELTATELAKGMLAK